MKLSVWLMVAGLAFFALAILSPRMLGQQGSSVEDEQALRQASAALLHPELAKRNAEGGSPMPAQQAQELIIANQNRAVAAERRAKWARGIFVALGLCCCLVAGSRHYLSEAT